ncbi:MAG TPA: tripartite tricarboxylate transporter substrate binding protein [Burkholderiales bacterium]|nr:tripartite tricarboxylate transporter substrate binding protein [Burkholderiales bacterium]
MKDWLAGLALLFATTLALGQAYPSRPVTFIVPFPPGGGTDISARTVAAKLSQMWKQSVVVENRAGAAGIVGADAAAKARPDGHTLLIVNVGMVSINPALYAKLPYDPDKAFLPVSLICELPFVLMASPRFPPNSVQELVAYARANPGKVTMASSGAGGSPHLTGEIFQLATGTKFTHVPYKGGGPAAIDLMAGHVDLLFASVLEGSGNIKAGKLKGLAVTHAKRNPAIPDVPTLAEAGVRNAESGSWIALLAPAGTPAAVIEFVNKSIHDAVASPDVAEKLIAQGAVPQPSTPAELQKLIATDLARYGRIIREQGLKAE